MISPPLVSTLDLDAYLLDYHSKINILGSFRSTSTNIEPKGQGNYFTNKDAQFRILSGVGLWYWRNKSMDFRPNPEVQENLSIPQGQLLDYFLKGSKNIIR